MTAAKHIASAERELQKLEAIAAAWTRIQPPTNPPETPIQPASNADTPED